MKSWRLTDAMACLVLLLLGIYSPVSVLADEWQTISVLSEEGGFNTHIQTKSLPMGIYGSWVTADGTVYAGTKGALYRSTDGGNTWGLPLKTWGGNSTVSGVFVSQKGHIFASAGGPDLPDADKGLWRSTNAGRTWKRVLSLANVPNGTSIWGMDEDAQGRLFAGAYGNQANKTRIFRSLNGGNTWSQVYENLNADHIHAIKVDRRTGYIYATYGDRINGILRSTNGGASFHEILPGLPQMVGIEITPTARLFGTDEWSTTGRIYRTTDDTQHNIVLNMDITLFNYWLRRDPIRGYIYAGFVDDLDQHPAARLYLSKDDGLTWSILDSSATSARYDGYQYASNIMGSLFYASVQQGGQQQGKGFRAITVAVP